MERNPEVELTSIKVIPDGDFVVESSSRNSAAVTIVTDSVVLQPGSKIRPQLGEVDAIRLAERLYGITTGKITELVSYDDRNFKIHVDT